MTDPGDLLPAEHAEIRVRMAATRESYATARRNLPLAKAAGDLTGPVTCPEGQCQSIAAVLGGESLHQTCTCWFCGQTVCVGCRRRPVEQVCVLCSSCQQLIDDEAMTNEKPIDDRIPSQVTDAFWLYAHPTAQASTSSTTDHLGKWMIFAPLTGVDAAWAVVEAAVKAGQLGPEAKVATARPNPHQRSARTRLICVYTDDYRDLDDIRRVLAALRRLGFRQRLSYKTDADTLALNYGPGTAMLVSPPESLTFQDRRANQGVSPSGGGPVMVCGA